MNKNLAAFIIIGIVILGVLGYIQYYNQPVRVHVTTTTSLYATGLLDYLADEFKKNHSKTEIEFIAVGSGEALKRAARGDACMVFVHAPSLEKKYIDEGVLKDHKIIAYNYFVIVGPSSDPAGIRNANSASEAFRLIYEAGEQGRALFISRGDNSGTNVKELSLWKLAGLDPKGESWYLESGQGMGQTLVMADQKNAYTLSDIGTFLKYKKDGALHDLVILYGNDEELINIYSIYTVSSCGGKEYNAAKAFYDFVTSHLDLIGKYGQEKYGQPLFYSAEGKETELESIWEELSNQ